MTAAVHFRENDSMRAHTITLTLIGIVAVAAGCDPLDPFNGLVEKQQPTEQLALSPSQDESPQAEESPAARPSSEQMADAKRNTNNTSNSNRLERNRPGNDSSTYERSDRKRRNENEVEREVDAQQVDEQQTIEVVANDQRVAKPRSNDDEKILFQLHTGTALPQSLPGGTALGVAVTYELSGQLDPSARYLLIVERSTGKPAELQFRPKQSDTIGGFIQGWQPTEGPFSCHIVEHASSGKRRRVSHDEFLR